MDGSPPGSSVHGILQARVLERVAIAFSIFICIDIDWIDLTCRGDSIFILQSDDNENMGEFIKGKLGAHSSVNSVGRVGEASLVIQSHGNSL